MKVPCEACQGRGWHWEAGSGPVCIHEGVADICDSCADFLVRILPIMMIKDGKPMQRDVALSMGYTTRHLRRLCANLGYHGWPEFYSAVRTGALLSVHDVERPSTVIPLRTAST